MEVELYECLEYVGNCYYGFMVFYMQFGKVVGIQKILGWKNIG